MNTDISATQRIEQAIGQCETLSILPALASRFLTQLTQMELTPASMTQLVESDPALMVLAIQLCRKKGIAPDFGDNWIGKMLTGISLREIRDSILSAAIYGGLEEDGRSAFRKELTRHSLATACCAEELAKIVTPTINSSMAYHCGLLHDIGKFLLDEVMPKSLDTLLEQARSEKSIFCKVEQENLGLDHTILGKRFAQKLHLPSDIILGIWLHHHQVQISGAIPQARISAIMELADGIVRRKGLGESGSYNDVSTDTIAKSLGLNEQQISQVENAIPGLVMQRSEIAGLTLLRPGWAYCDALKTMTSQLAVESSKLSDESSRLQSSASYFDFIKELLPKINADILPVEMAGHFAAAWQRFYQTGPVCVFLTGQADTKSIEAVIVENLNNSKTMTIELPQNSQMPAMLNDKFTISDIDTFSNSLLDECEINFDRSRIKQAILKSGDKTSGILLFELRHPIMGDISQRFEPAAKFGAILLDMLDSIGRQQWLAERFSLILSNQQTRPVIEDIKPKTDKIGETNAEALAEMAGGAAHELNNPLSVISGRSQLLAQTENDPAKKRILSQIQQNAGELSSIIDDLMSFANPPAPKPTEISVKQIIDEAIDLAAIKIKFNRDDIKIAIEPQVPNVFVDSAQVACAIANIICNGFESYETGTGLVTLQVSNDKSRQIIIKIADSGRGMDEQTRVKATQPFFSAKPAGRKRGMGLAHSQRLLQINKGSLTINSQPAKGTTVTFTLPAKQ